MSIGGENEQRHKHIYNEAKRKYRAKIKEAKISANDNYIKHSKNSCKAAWDIIKVESNRSKVKQEVPVSTNAFNDYFISSVSHTTINNTAAIDLVDNYISSCNGGINCFKWQSIDHSKVLKSVSKLSSSQSED